MARKTTAQPKPKTYATHVTAPGGKRIYVRGKTKEDLQQKVAEVKMAMGAGVDVTDDTLFADYARMWARVYKAPPKLRPNSYATLTGNLDRFVLPSFEGMKLRDVKPLHIQNFLSAIAGKSASTQQKCIQIVKAVFKTAEENGLIMKNPVRSDVRPMGAPVREQEEALTDQQALTLLNAVKGTRAFLFCLLALTTGMRRGEILGLMWGDIDLESRNLHVQHNKTFVEGSSDAPVTTLLKSSAANRVIPIPDALCQALKEEKEHSTSPYVLCMANGESLSKASFASLWAIVTARTATKGRPLGSAIRGSNLGPLKASLDFSCHPHQLRHTYITQLFEAGMDVKQVQYLAGHSTPDMTLKVYTHYRRKVREKETAEKVTQALGYISRSATQPNAAEEPPAQHDEAP